MAKLTLSDLASLANQTSAIATINANNALIETALENTLSRDGTSPNAMGASLDMNDNRITNLPAPVAATEPLRLEDLAEFLDSGSLDVTIPALPLSTTDLAAAKWSGTAGDELLTSTLILNTASINPSTSDLLALGTSTLMFSDLFLASGAVINFNNGDVTITHGANALGFAGGIYSFVPSANVTVADQATYGLKLYNAAGTNIQVALATDGTDAYIQSWSGGVLQLNSQGNQVRIGPDGIHPATTDVAMLGSTSLMWADLFLASGAVINFNNGDVTITHSADNLAISGGSLTVADNAYITSAVVTRGGTATPAAASAVPALTMGSALIGVYWGSGAPGSALTAPQGSLYLRTDGSSTTTRAYINTNGGTTWTAISTVA